MKPIRLSNHAETQMILMGARKEEIEKAICSGKWESAKFGKLKTKYYFKFNSISPVNKKFYQYKIVEPIPRTEIENCHFERSEKSHLFSGKISQTLWVFEMTDKSMYCEF